MNQFSTYCKALCSRSKFSYRLNYSSGNAVGAGGRSYTSHLTVELIVRTLSRLKCSVKHISLQCMLSCSCVHFSLVSLHNLHNLVFLTQTSHEKHLTLLHLSRKHAALSVQVPFNISQSVTTENPHTFSLTC